MNSNKKPIFKPVVAQLKTSLFAQSKSPVAPPVYRPQPVPRVLQTKSALPPSVHKSQAPQRFAAPIPRAPFPAIQPVASKVVQRASAAKKLKSQWAEYDDIWWPKACRLAGPYSGLDCWDEWGMASRFKEFTSEQIAILIEANKNRNGGKLKSDAADDYPGKALSVVPGRLNSVECDHVIPKSQGGANHWWNARLISRKLNNKIERVVDAKDKDY